MANGAVQYTKQTLTEFKEDRCPMMAAALAYYTIFSLPPLLILVIMIAGIFVDPQQIQGSIQDQMQSMLGQQGAQQITTMIRNANRPGSGGPLAVILSLAALAFSATGAFFQLQKALNAVWEVEPDPEQGGLKHMIVKRVLSFGMILVIAFLLLVSLIVSAMISAFGGFFADLLPGAIGPAFLWVLDLAVSLAIVFLLFAAIFKILPDVKLRWKDVWFGAAVTAVLFYIGKFIISFYLGRSNPGDAFGAAGSLAVILLWVFFSAMILFLGAEFTQVWARRRGESFEPKKGAVKVVEEKRRVRDHGEESAA